MELKERLKRGLLHTRGFTDRVLSEIKEPEDWIRRPADGVNHALWIAGHLGIATNSFIGLVDPTGSVDRETWKPLFGKGSQSIDDLTAYPAPSEVAGFLTERGNVFISLLEDCSDQDLCREVPGGPGFMYDVAAVFQMSAWHEALHCGQLTVIHRMIGQSPIADRS